MCNHIYWLFGDDLLKTLCERYSLARAVCYGKVTPWPFGFGPEEREVPFEMGSHFSAGKRGILTTSFVELFCCISLSRPLQCTDKQVPGYYGGLCTRVVLCHLKNETILQHCSVYFQKIIFI